MVPGARRGIVVAMSETPLPSPENAPPEPPRRLLRSRDERVIGGVCGGLARYFNVDPLIFRIAAVALVFVGGFAIVAYIAALLLVPDDDGTGQAVAGKPGRVATVVGAFVIVLAGVALLDGQWGIGFGWFFGALVADRADRRGPRGRRPAAAAPAAARTSPRAARIVGAALIVVAVMRRRAGRWRPAPRSPRPRAAARRRGRRDPARRR